MKEINSIQNINIKEWAKLKQVKYRNQINQVILEGWHICLELFNFTNYDDLIIQVLLHKKEIDRFNNFLSSKKIPQSFQQKITIVNDLVLNKLTSYDKPQPIMIILNIANYFNMVNKGYDYKHILLLDHIQDPTNLGTIFRTALAFDFHKILLFNDCVDLFNAKVLSTSQGAFLKLDIEVLDNDQQLLSLKKQNYCFITTNLHQGFTNLEDFHVDKNINYVYCFGNEGNGLSKQISNMKDENVLININAQLDSLSVSQATTIFMYEIYKKSQEK